APIAASLVVLGLVNAHAAQRTRPQRSNATPAAERAIEQPSTIAMHADPNVLFKTGDNCMACHNSLTAPSGEDVSIGIAWRASIMANSARDPYWQAGVRREIIDHPG